MEFTLPPSGLIALLRGFLAERRQQQQQSGQLVCGAGFCFPLPPGGGAIQPPPIDAAPPPPLGALPPPVVPLPLPTPPIAPLPTGGDLLDELLRRPHTIGRPPGPTTTVPEFERLLRKPPLSEFERLIQGRTFVPKGGIARGAVRVAAGAARVLGSSAVGVLGGVLWPGELGDSVLTARDLERIERRRRGPRTRPRTKPQATRRPPPGGLPPVSPYLGVPTVTAPRAPLPAPAPATPLPSAAPASPQPAPARPPAAAPAPSPHPSPARRPVAGPSGTPAPARAPLPTGIPNLIPYALPFLLQLPGGANPTPLRFSTPLPDVLTGFQPGQPPPLVSPVAPGLGPAPLTGLQPQPLSFLQPPPDDPCKCTTTRKPRKRKPPRTVCYAGDYREKARGLTKERRRKIPCQ